jgi:hypothetical protein
MSPAFRLVCNVGPGRLDETAAQRGRGLLVLAGEIVFADRLAYLLSMGSGSRLGCKASPCRRVKTRPRQGVDQVPPVLFGDRRKTDDLPILLRQYVAGQIVPVTPEGRLSCSRCMISMTAPFLLTTFSVSPVPSRSPPGAHLFI